MVIMGSSVTAASGLDLPPLFSMELVGRLEKAVVGDDPYEIAAALGEDGSTFKKDLMDPFFLGFVRGRKIEQRFKDLGRMQQQKAAPPALAMSATQWGAQGQQWGAVGHEAAGAHLLHGATEEQILNSIFSFDTIFVPDPRFPQAARIVSPASYADFDLIGRADLKNLSLSCSELNPTLSVASSLAKSLKQHPIRCLSLVIEARRSNDGIVNDEESILLDATRLYFDQQIRILSLICRLLREAAILDGGGDGEGGGMRRQHYRAVVNVMGGEATSNLSANLCEAMRYSFFDYATTSASGDQGMGSDALARETRRGREGEIRMISEGILLLLSIPSVAQIHIWHIVALYLEFSGFFDMAGTEDIVTFCGAMLACAITSALLHPQGAGRKVSFDELARILECGSDRFLNVDAAPLPAKGYLQIVLAASQMMSADDSWQISLWHAVLNRALSHVNGKLIPCAILERWADYSVELVSKMEGVLLLLVSAMRDKLDEFAILVESANPERKHETITCLFRSLARAYTMLPHESRSMFEGHELELIKRWMIKTLSHEDQRDAKFFLKGSFLELLAAFFDGLKMRLASPHSASTARDDMRELLRVVDGILEPMQIAPHDLIATLREYAEVVSSFLRLPQGEGYFWTPERQQLLGSVMGHSEGQVFLQGPSDEHRQEEREKWRAYECHLIDYLVRWMHFLRSTLPATRFLEASFDPFYPLAPASLLRFGRDLLHLWSSPLPSPIKAEMVQLFAAMIREGGGREKEALDMMWGDFIVGIVMQPVQLLQQVQYQQSIVTPSSTPAFMFEFLDLDRTRASHEHSLALLSLLQVIIERLTPWDNCFKILQSCAALIPEFHSGPSGVGFSRPSHRWMLSSNVFRLVTLAIQRSIDFAQCEISDFGSHPAPTMTETLLGWVVRGDEGGLGLKGKIVEIVCTGLHLADESQDPAELPHLAEAIESAISLLNIASSISTQYYVHSNFFDELIAERGLGAGRQPLIITLFRYLTLHDEPKLARSALDLARIVCKERDSDIYQILCSETSPAIRQNIISACASWLEFIPPTSCPGTSMNSDGNVRSSGGGGLAEGVISLILESLCRADTEGCVAHFLLGFTPFKISKSDLTNIGGYGSLLRIICAKCVEGEMEYDWNISTELRAAGAQKEEISGSNAEDKKAHLAALAQKQGCLEAIYHLSRHPETRSPMLAFLFAPWPLSAADSVEKVDSSSLLYELASRIPDAHVGNAVISHLRNAVKMLREGDGLGNSLVSKLWSGGLFDLTETEAEKAWDRMITDAFDGGDRGNDYLEILMMQRWRCEDQEGLLKDALDLHIESFHQSGWFLHTVAQLLRSAFYPDESVWKDTYRDKAIFLLKILFGGAHGEESLHSQVGGVSLSLWKPGQFQWLLDEAMDIPDVEISDGVALFEALEASDYEQCGRSVDRWSHSLFVYDEAAIMDRLCKRLAERGLDRGDAFGVAEQLMSRRVVNSYDGYNTIRRCQSARQHLLCGLQDVLEQALISGLLEDGFCGDSGGGNMSSLLFCLLEKHLIPPASATKPVIFAVNNFAEHVTRCIGLAVASLCRLSIKQSAIFLGGFPSIANNSSFNINGGDGGHLNGAIFLSFLDRILAIQTSAATSGSLTLRTNLYVTILNLVQHLQRDSLSCLADAAVSSSPEDVESVVSKHRAALLRIAVKDLASPDDMPPSWDPSWEGRTVALALVQALLPIGRGPASSPLFNGSHRSTLPNWSFVSSAPLCPAGLGVTGATSQYHVLMHLLDDLDGRTALSEVLDITLTDSRHPHLLAYLGKMNVLLQMAQDPESLSELTKQRILDKLAGCSFLRTHSQGEHHLRSLLRRPKGGFQLGVLALRFHQLLKPALQLFVALLHDARNVEGLRLSAARFLWGHRRVFAEVCCGRPGDGGVEDECADEARLLAEGIATADRLGAFSVRDSREAVRWGGELDLCVSEWMRQTLTRALGVGMDSVMAGGGGVGKAGEQALRFFQGRAARDGQSFLNCSELLSSRLPSIDSVGSVSVHMLVDLLVKSVDTICGADVGLGDYHGAAGNVEGAMGAGMWRKLRDLVTERDLLRAQSATGTTQVLSDEARLSVLEEECIAANGRLRRVLCHSEVILTLIVDSLSIQERLSLDGQGGASIPTTFGDVKAAVSSVSCSHKLWNRSRNGAVQRLHHFYRIRHAERSLPCDFFLMQRLVNQLLAHLRPVMS